MEIKQLRIVRISSVYLPLPFGFNVLRNPDPWVDQSPPPTLFQLLRSTHPLTSVNLDYLSIYPSRAGAS